VTDFRSARMESPEGRGIARRAWDAYVKAIDPVARPFARVLAEKMAPPVALDLAGFWLLWHAEGGFEGLRRMGMSRSSIYRRISLFRRIFGVHPDEYQMPGVELNITKYQSTPAVPAERESVPA
jgi:hypothetical protein